MKQPPLLPALFVVTALGFVHLEMQDRLPADLPVRHVVAATLVLAGAGAAVTPLGRLVRREDAASAAGDEPDTAVDLDVSA